MDVDSGKKHCSFCGEQGETGKPLVGGLGAFMCGDCVDYYKRTLDAIRDTGVVSPPPWHTMSDVDILGKLSLITQTGDQVDAFLVEWVQLARSRKLSWAEVGKALGISRQAAWERFARSDGTAADAPDQELGSA